MNVRKTCFCGLISRGMLNLSGLGNLNLYKTKAVGDLFKGWEVSQGLDAPAKDKQFFGKISFWTKRFGSAFTGWDIFPGGCFHIGSIANQSLNQTPFGRRLVPRCARPDSEGVRKLRLLPPSPQVSAAIDCFAQSRMVTSFDVGGDSAFGEWIRAARMDIEEAGFDRNLFLKMDIGFGMRMMVPRSGWLVAKANGKYYRTGGFGFVIER